MSSPYWVQLYVKTVFNSIFIDFMTFFYELTWFSTASRGLCSVTSKMCVEIMESLSESRLCQSDNLKMTFSRVKMHFQGFLHFSIHILHQCSTFVSPETRMWSLPSHLHSELNSLAMCVQSAISGHIFLPRIYGTSSSDGRATALFCYEMLLYTVKEPVCNWNLCGYYQTNNCPSGEKKIITL